MKNGKHFSGNATGKALRLLLFLLTLIYLQTLPSVFSNRPDRRPSKRPGETPAFRLTMDSDSMGALPPPAAGDTSGKPADDSPIVTLSAREPQDSGKPGLALDSAPRREPPKSVPAPAVPSEEAPKYKPSRAAAAARLATSGGALLANAATFLVPNYGSSAGGSFGGGSSSGGALGSAFPGLSRVTPLSVVSP
jgi:hypothetical protein